MGKFKIHLLGVGVVCLGAFGTYNAISDFGKAPEVKSDLTTTGKVTHMSGTELRHRLGGTISTTYKMQFSFQAEDGNTYFGEENLEKSEFNALSKGDTISVKYHSSQPGINAAPAYGFYAAVDMMPDATPQFRLFFCLGTLALGSLIVFYAVRFADNEPAGDYAMQA